jgi:hypothetical protein
MITVYETAYYGPTDHRGQRIKVTNKRTGNSRWHHWDYSVNPGLWQHEHAVRECAVWDFKRVEMGGETDKGWLFVTTTQEEEV